MNWTDEINPEYDVVVESFFESWIDLNFSRVPDVLIYQELMLIHQKLGYEVEISNQETQYTVFKPTGVKSSAIVQTLVKMLESHQLKLFIEILED